MGALREHRIAVVHLTDRRAIDIILCDDDHNRVLLEEYCHDHHISLMYCKNNEAVKLLVSTTGAGIGVFTNADTDDRNECMFRRSLAFHSQRELLAILGAWGLVEPVELQFDEGIAQEMVIP